MKTLQHYLLALLSGLLLAFAWFPNGFFALAFVAFIPLLYIEQHLAKERKSITLFLCAYLSFLMWNILVTWWVKNASFGGAAMAILCNALLMAIVFFLFHQTKKRIGYKYGSIVFIVFWLAFEHFHFRWDLNWPWLTLGNVFAYNNAIIQWYEYTGVAGGSFWVLLINVLLFDVFANTKNKQSKMIEKKHLTKKWLILAALIILPIVFSFLIKIKTNAKTSSTAYVVLVQPNIDPYNTKFTLSNDQQVALLLQQAFPLLDSNTDYLIFPETALSQTIEESELSLAPSILSFKKLFSTFPKLKIIIGITTSKTYLIGETPSLTARQYDNSDTYYDVYNTAVQIDSSANIQVYHKSKLVPGVEKMPFPWLMNYFEDYAIDLGGTTGSLGVQAERTVFYSTNKKQSTAPVICYESVFGEFVGNYISNGAQFISIITNDGWWGDTPGYKQHLMYGALRAIETRKWIARSANTGTSCFISPLGEVQKATKWWKKAAIKQQIELNNTQTVYVCYGDYIGRTAILLSLLIWATGIFFRINNRRKRSLPL
jgi:apolipoprotein N-acyltransferase